MPPASHRACFAGPGAELVLWIVDRTALSMNVRSLADGPLWEVGLLKAMSVFLEHRQVSAVSRSLLAYEISY